MLESASLFYQPCDCFFIYFHAEMKQSLDKLRNFNYAAVFSIDAVVEIFIHYWHQYYLILCLLCFILIPYFTY